MKKHNPHTPILIREAQNVEPKVFARYGAPRRPSLEHGVALADGSTTEFGKEKMLPLSGLDDATIENKVTELVKSS
ncbi:hypothetical protein SLS54_001564 [Diplodia seriata]